MLNNDTISREAVLGLAYDISEIDGEHFSKPCMVVDVEDIQALPSVTPSRRYGAWIGIDEEPHEDFECCVCGKAIYAIEDLSEYKFCPNCGARMESEDK